MRLVDHPRRHHRNAVATFPSLPPVLTTPPTGDGAAVAQAEPLCALNEGAISFAHAIVPHARRTAIVDHLRDAAEFLKNVLFFLAALAGLVAAMAIAMHGF
ncbi:hypothetical protein [Marinivivus vitaminiproducens]|uniref:hypothetical protein n=1 Tax=Marinivivus vitaminiproducens TaxID=3035935 RepID=UPI0027AB87E7|nr:hypothetical protein P4R82_04405 [Geminicoccaceae bacterium SCSIO 64248]